MKSLGIILIICLWFAINSCEKVQSYSSIPEIELKSYKVFDTVDSLNNKVKCLDVELNFVDGDGDLFSPIDTTNLNSPVSELHWIFYKKESREFVRMPDSLMKTPTSYHLPYSDVMERVGQNKTQKGTIKYDLQLSYIPILEPFAPYDTLEIEFYIVDMAEHKSNIVRTPQIVLK